MFTLKDAWLVQAIYVIIYIAKYLELQQDIYFIKNIYLKMPVFLRDDVYEFNEKNSLFIYNNRKICYDIESATSRSMQFSGS